MNLADLPVDVLQSLLDQARDAGDGALVVLYADALEQVARQWIPQSYQQVPDGNWAIWQFLGGRGCGKSDAGAGAMDAHATGPACDPRLPGGHRMRIIGPTFSDTIASCVTGPTGLRAHNPEIELVTTKEGTICRWPNGSRARIHGAYTPEDPERLRAGGNACFDWFEEMAAWRQLETTWNQAMLGLRIGDIPRTVITTTPKNVPKVKELVALGETYEALPAEQRADLPRSERVALTRATTSMNRYLPEEVRASLYAQYAGTRLGSQELEALILEDLGAFFTRSWFGWRDTPTDWPRKVRSWDLAGTPITGANQDPDWTVGALVAYQPTPRAWTLADGTEILAGAFCVEDVIRMRDSPAQVEQAVVDAARHDGPTVQVIIEREPGQSGKSQLAHFQQALSGLALVNEHSPSGPKAVRAQLVSSAAQQGRVEIVRGPWNVALLDELEQYVGDERLDKHDDQVDSLSQAFGFLEGRGGPASVQAASGQMPSRAAILSGRGGRLGGLPSNLGGN